MTIDELKNNLNAVVNTLNCIEVRGKDNLNRLLGTIMLLEKVMSGVKNIETPEVVSVEVANAEDQAE